jgi:hypothetical protein
MIKKAAVIGMSSGHWIATRGMKDLCLRMQCGEHTQVTVDHGVEHPVEHFVGPGVHKIAESAWTRIAVTNHDGPVLGFLEGR